MSSPGKPLFVYSYDPPSPDVLSEYDPPYPLQSSTPHAASNAFEFSGLETFASEEPNVGHIKNSKESLGYIQGNEIPQKILLYNSEQYTEETNRNENSILDSNNESAMFFKESKSNCNLERGIQKQLPDFDKNKDASEMSQDTSLKKLSDFVFYPNRNPFDIFDQTDESSSGTSSDNTCRWNAKETTAENDKSNGQADQIAFQGDDTLQCSKFHTSVDITESEHNSFTVVDSTNFKNENSFSEFVTEEVSETIYPSDGTTYLEEARCLSPDSTAQSVSSLPSDTITINVAPDSSLSGNENQAADWDADVPLNIMNESYPQHTLRNNALQNFLDCDTDSGLQSPSPTFSPFLTESCTITPFPTDCITPISTNPTSTPLPSPIQSEVVSTITSESSPSTPSTVTSSTMFCISRKLESLTNAQRAADCASNKDCKGVAKSVNVTKQIYDESSKHEVDNLRFNQTSLISDNTSEELVKNKHCSKYENIVSNNAFSEPVAQTKISNPNFINGNGLTTFQEPATFNSVYEPEEMTSRKVRKLSKTFDGEKENEERGEEKIKSNIYRYSPQMEKSHVNELKQVFGGKTKLSCRQKPSFDQVKHKPSISHYRESSKNYHNGTEIVSVTKKTELNNFTVSNISALSQPLYYSSSRTTPPPPPPQRSNLFHKALPPPIPPPPEEEILEEIPPPIPSLPFNVCVHRDTPDFLTPPTPPTRQYLLIPLTPGKCSPILLTPHSLSPPSSLPLQNSPPTPPPRQSTPGRELDRDSIASPDAFIGANGKPFRHLSVTRELTPVPEERTPDSKSPSPQVVRATLERHIDSKKETKKKVNGVLIDSKKETKMKVNGVLIEAHRHNEDKAEGEKFPVAPQRPGTFGTGSPSYIGPHTPPPLPPKSNSLKISPLKVLPPPPPKRSGSLPSRTPSPRVSSPIITPSRLSPCRVLERSPPNDRVFEISPTGHCVSGSTQQDNPTPSVEPPPPPPTPLNRDLSSCMSFSPYGKLVVNRTDLPLPSPEDEIRKVFANAKMWGWVDEGRETLALYTQFRPAIQQGPQCGLVALSMASQACSSSVSTEELLTKARAKGISRHGEMFSAEDMSQLSNETLRDVVASVKTDLLSSASGVVKTLLGGDFILFPYDAEPNHFPGLRKGSKSHWGLLCGCLVQSEAFTFRFDSSFLKPDPQVDHLWHARPATRAKHSAKASSVPPPKPFGDTADCRCALSVSPEARTRDAIDVSHNIGPEGWEDQVSSLVVLYRQGKSRNLIYCPLRDLFESNLQLVEYQTSEDFVIDSIQKGLAGQVVVIHKQRPGLSDLLGILREEISD